MKADISRILSKYERSVGKEKKKSKGLRKVANCVLQ